jgi:hypothetical protein
MVPPNPFETTRKFDVAGVAVGVCDGKMAEEKTCASNSLISAGESSTIPARSFVFLSMRSVTLFENMAGCEFKKEEIAQHCG